MTLDGDYKNLAIIVIAVEANLWIIFSLIDKFQPKMPSLNCFLNKSKV